MLIDKKRYREYKPESSNAIYSVSRVINMFFGDSLFYPTMTPAEYIIRWNGKCPVILIVLMGRGRSLKSGRALIGVGCPEEIEKIAHERRIPAIILPPPCPPGYEYRLAARWCLKRLPEYSVTAKIQEAMNREL